MTVPVTVSVSVPVSVVAEPKIDRGGGAPAIITRRGFTPLRRHDPVFIGPGTWYWNPFQRVRIDEPRALILYRAWLSDLLTPRILRAAWFSDDEIVALAAWRARLSHMLAHLAGRTLRCTCRRADAWCHRNSLARRAVGSTHTSTPITQARGGYFD